MPEVTADLLNLVRSVRVAMDAGDDFGVNPLFDMLIECGFVTYAEWLVSTQTDLQLLTTCSCTPTCLDRFVKQRSFPHYACSLCTAVIHRVRTARDRYTLMLLQHEGDTTESVLLTNLFAILFDGLDLPSTFRFQVLLTISTDSEPQETSDA